MEFFYGIISKYKNYIIVSAVLIVCFVLNDIIIFKVSKPYKNDSVTANSSEIALNISDEKNDESVINNQFYVDVKGEVKKPGVYLVDSSMKVDDAIKLAGGLTKNASTLDINLSKKLYDQMVIIVSKKEKKSVSVTNCNSKSNLDNNTVLNNDASILSNSSDISSSDIKEDYSTTKSDVVLVNLNLATIDELTTLPGIGESKAEKIIEYRKDNCFNSIEDIMNVSGIGEALFEKIKAYITV